MTSQPDPRLARPALIPPRPPAQRRPWLMVALLAGTLGAAWWAFPGDHGAPPPARSNPAAFTAAAAAPGRVEPATEERDVTAELRGKLAEVLVDEGDAVKAGQLVAQLINDEYKAKVTAARGVLAQRQAELDKVRAGARGQERREAEAQRREADAQVVQARKDYERREVLATQGHISREALDRARNDLAAAVARAAARRERENLIEADSRTEDVRIAEALLLQAQGGLAEAEAYLEKTYVRAPIDGVVLHRFKRGGEGVSDQPPTPIVKIGDLSRLRVRVDVDETDVAKITLGMPAYVTADGYPGMRFSGQVIRIGQRLGRKTLRTDDPVERNDTKVLETLVELAPGAKLPAGLRVDAFLGSAPRSDR